MISTGAKRSGVAKVPDRASISGHDYGGHPGTFRTLSAVVQAGRSPGDKAARQSGLSNASNTSSEYCHPPGKDAREMDTCFHFG